MRSTAWQPQSLNTACFPAQFRLRSYGTFHNIWFPNGNHEQATMFLRALPLPPPRVSRHASGLQLHTDSPSWISRKNKNNTTISFLRLRICRLSSSSSFSSLVPLNCYHTGPALVGTPPCEVLRNESAPPFPTKYVILCSRNLAHRLKSLRVLPLFATTATHIGPCLCLTGPTRDSAGLALVAVE